MSATHSPNPQNILLLAGLGIGAYWLMTRRAQAGTVIAPRTGGSVPAQTSPLSRASAFVQSLFGAAPVQTVPIGVQQGGGTAVLTPGAGSRGTLETSQQPYVPFEDGFSFNTPNSSVYDALVAQQASGQVDYGQFL